MHKQKTTRYTKLGSRLVFLSFFLFTIAVQTFPFFPNLVMAGSNDIKSSQVSANWADANTINVSAKGSGKFPGTSVPISKVINWKYTYVGDGIDPEGVAGQKRRIYEANDGGAAALNVGDPYRCENSGTSHVSWRNQRTLNDDTMRIDVTAIGDATGYLRVRFNPNPDNKSNCVSQDLQVNIGNSTAAGTLGSWLDSANIKLTTIYAATYQKSTTNPKQFISQAANQGPCKDVLVRTGDDNDLGSPITVYDQESIANATDPITYVKRISPIDSSCGLAGSVSGYVSNTNQAETAVAGSGLNSDTTTVPPSCNSSGSGVLNWLFCAVIDAVDNTISSVNGIVDNMLSLDASSIASNDKLYLLWSYFRNISSLLLVVIALVMIIAQSMGNS